jgi:transposase
LARSDLELKAGHKPARGRKGAAHAYNIRSYREQERRFIEQAEAAYATLCHAVARARSQG